MGAPSVFSSSVTPTAMPSCLAAAENAAQKAPSRGTERAESCSAVRPHISVAVAPHFREESYIRAARFSGLAQFKPFFEVIFKAAGGSGLQKGDF